MKPINFLALFLVIGVAILQSSCCDEKVNFQIVRGSLNEDECKDRLKGEAIGIDDAPNTSVICPGEPCTICYLKENINKINISDSHGLIDEDRTNDFGVIQFTPDKTTTITLSPENSCAPSKSATVYVLTDAQDIPITGSWDTNLSGQNNCKNIIFKLSETFVSPNIYAIELKADWDDALVKKAANGVDCSIPPFLSVFDPSNVSKGSHTIPAPRQWKKMPRKWKAVGDYSFVPEYIENCDTRKNCDLRIDFPFVIYMSCDEEEPYRQP